MSAYYKTVTDPVHGNIGLTRAEADVMTSATMQRLHNVRQLGLAHLVFPGANYSRFSHSVGACHNASKILSALSRNSGKEIDPIEAQIYRIVALLHDIGHYPFSHATEHVVENFYADALLQPKSSSGADNVDLALKPGSTTAPYYKHEPLGEIVIRSSPELAKIFNNNGLDRDVIADRFAKTKPDGLIGIISSDLDCDRLDYLKRTALNSGAPYGSVDIGFLIDQATLDKDGNFCFRQKAARSADHLLVARYFDYMQVTFHKTVVALEWSLTTCLEALLAREMLDLSGPSLINLVSNGEWSTLDDQKVIELFRKLRDENKIGNSDEILVDHLTSILDRQPAKLIASWDRILANKDEPSIAKDQFIAKKLVAEVCEELSLDSRRIYLWKTPVLFSKFDGSSEFKLSEESAAEAVLLLDENTGSAAPLAAREDTLIRLLSGHRMAGLRLYYLPEKGVGLDDETKKKILARFSAVLGKPVF